MYKRQTIMTASIAVVVMMITFAPSFGQSVAPPNPAFLDYINRKSIAAKSVNTPPTGYIPSPLNLSHLKGQQLFGEKQAMSLPASYDLRTLGKVSSVKNQGDCGSCWAFAALGSLESYLLNDESWDFSENNMKNTHGFDCTCCAGGNIEMATAYLMRWSGPVSESSDPYDEMSCSSGATNYNVLKHVQQVIFIPERKSSTDNDNIKQCIVSYGAVWAAFYCRKANAYYFFNNAKTAYYYDGSDYDESDPSFDAANHAVCIVGWDDNYSKTNFKSGTQPSGNGAFIIKNSWGTSYNSDNGYFYMSYYDERLAINTKYDVDCRSAVFTAEPTNNYSQIYQHDELGWVSSIGANTGTSETAWFGNVFKAEADAELSAVSWGTASKESDFELYVYLQPDSGPIKTSGYALKQTGTVSMPGYATVKLDTPVPLTQGQTFSVVVKLKTPDNYYPIPIEQSTWYYDKDGNKEPYSTGATASAGQSYYSFDGSNWADTTTLSSYDSKGDGYGYDGTKTNVCLKAYATLETDDTMPPTISITSPTSNDTYETTSSSITLSGAASDDTGLSCLSWENTDTGDEGTCSGTETWTASDIALRAGKNAIVITATDIGGNTASDTITVNRDVVTLSSITLSPSIVGTQGTSRCTASATDSLGYNVTYKWSDGGVGGTFSSSDTAATTYTAPTVADNGDITIIITCTAASSVNPVVSGSATARLRVLGNHEITITSGPTATPSEVNAGKTVSCSITAEDGARHSVTYSWSDGGAGGSFSSSSNRITTYTAPTNSTGKDLSVKLICKASCILMSGVNASGSVTIKVIDPAPTIAISSPTSDATTNRTGAAVKLGGTASSDTTAITWANSTTGDTGSVAGAKSWSVSNIPLEIGLNEITVTASDIGGKTASDSIEITCEDVSVADAWHGMAMVSLPIIPDYNDPADVVDFSGAGWCAWVTTDGEYATYTGDSDLDSWFMPTSATPGRGFWAKFSGTPDVPCGEVPDQSENVSIALYKGWNLIGQPFLTSVNWDLSAIKAVSGNGTEYALKDAGAYVRSYAWGWDPDAYAYYLVGDPSKLDGATADMAPWKAYWIKAVQDCFLMLPAP